MTDSNLERYLLERGDLLFGPREVLRLKNIGSDAKVVLLAIINHENLNNLGLEGQQLEKITTALTRLNMIALNPNSTHPTNMFSTLPPKEWREFQPDESQNSKPPAQNLGNTSATQPKLFRKTWNDNDFFADCFRNLNELPTVKKDFDLELYRHKLGEMQHRFGLSKDRLEHEVFSFVEYYRDKKIENPLKNLNNFLANCTLRSKRGKGNSSPKGNKTSQAEWELRKKFLPFE